MRKKGVGNLWVRLGACVGTRSVSVLFLSVVRRFVARYAPGPLEIAIDVEEDSKCVHVLGSRDRVEKTRLEPFPKRHP